jgi:hypothetical protein
VASKTVSVMSAMWKADSVLDLKRVFSGRDANPWPLAATPIRPNCRHLAHSTESTPSVVERAQDML